MPLPNINDPNVIKFLIDNYEKTARLRMRWNHYHADKLRQAATLTREEKGYYETDVIKEALARGMATIERDNISGAENRRKAPIRDGVHITNTADIKIKHPIVDVGLGDPKQDPRLARPDTDLSIDPVMRPVNPKQNRLIYKVTPLSGRALYIKERNKMAPEDKYYFNVTSGWDYGWRLRDSYFNKNQPKYGRVWLLTHGASSRTGPQPDPIHYKDLTIPGPCKFC